MRNGSDSGLAASNRRDTEPFVNTACLIGLGANLGERERTLLAAIDSLRNAPEISRLVASGFYETAPIGGPTGQDRFLNAAVAFHTPLPAARLLERLQALEAELGRQPSDRWAARVIDLDLLLYGDQTIATESLSVPHPWLPFRRFVLEPATEVAAAMIHPPTGQSISELLTRLNRRPIRIVVVGDSGHLRNEFARVLSSEPESSPFTLVDDTSDSTLADIRIVVAPPDEGRNAYPSSIPTLRLSQNRSRATDDFVAMIGAISDCPRRQPDFDT